MIVAAVEEVNSPVICLLDHSFKCTVTFVKFNNTDIFFFFLFLRLRQHISRAQNFLENALL